MKIGFIFMRLIDVLELSEIYEKNFQAGCYEKFVLGIPTTYVLPPCCRHVLDYEDVIRASVGPLRLYDSDWFVPPSSCRLPKLLLVSTLHDTQINSPEFVARIDREFQENVNYTHRCAVCIDVEMYSRMLHCARFKFKGT